ncbi:MAG: hypothetical protein ACLRTG_13530 [Enterocloster aldenensis]
MGNIDGRCDKKAVMKYAGAFIAWVIGSGFATGQEILQFFTSYGYYSYGVVVLNLVGFLFLGNMLMTTGYAHKKDGGFNHFTYYCGKRAGTFYSWLVLGTLLLLIAVLVSGAGAALSEYYGLNRYIGSLIMSALVLGAYLVGFERLIRIVSAIGPVIIVFTLFVGVVTVIRDFGNITQAGEYGTALAVLRPSPSWMVSSVLYLSLNFLSGSTYFTALGMTAKSRKDAKWGAIWGAATLVLSIAIMNTAILLHGGTAASLSVPTLYLAKEISFVLGAVFSIVLVLGIFSSCSTMMWTVCNRIPLPPGTARHGMAAAVTVFTYILGMLPFAKLVNLFYPLVGYLGLVFVACVLYRGIKGLFVLQ